MDIAKIKASAASIDTTMLKKKFAHCKGIITAIIQRIDMMALAKGLITVTVIYSLLFLYVYLNSAGTIAKLESQVIVENVPITHVEKSHTQITNVPASMSVIDGLHEVTDTGHLPIIRKEDNLTSFRAYQHPFTFKNIGNKPLISFIIMDYGLSKEQSLTALDLLPPEISFILSPYSSLPGEWMSMAQSKGHEVWLSLPIQNKKSHNLGGNTVYHHSPLLEKKNNMHKSLVKTQGYIGIGSYTDDSTNSAKQHYIELAEDLYTRGLGILELNPNAPTFIEGKALSMGAPYIKADLEVFRIRGKENSFETLEAIAQEKGHAVAIIPNYPATIKNLAVWIMKVAQADYIIAPVSAIYDLPLHRSNNNASAKKMEIDPTPLHRDDHREPEDIHQMPTSAHHDVQQHTPEPHTHHH
ncbi:MAG: hypothetical protein COB36_00445 [Alphaproteobacteria bacterium]|nr:MAG: hypothetical protein COB36_00445 [Alphaproteobacteria bacterium]